MCLLVVVALVTCTLQAVLSPAPSQTASDGDATGARWLASLAGPGAQDTVVGASGAVGYATPHARDPRPAADTAPHP